MKTKKFVTRLLRNLNISISNNGEGHPLTICHLRNLVKLTYVQLVQGSHVNTAPTVMSVEDAQNYYLLCHYADMAVPNWVLNNISDEFKQHVNEQASN